MTAELEKLKTRLLKSGPTSDFSQVITLCDIMKIVGGYEQLMNMPIPAMQVVAEYINWSNEQENKSMKKSKRK